MTGNMHCLPLAAFAAIAARGHPWLPAFILAVNVALMSSYVLSDWFGACVMIGLIAVCLPVALHLGRQQRRGGTGAAGMSDAPIPTGEFR